MKTRTELKYQAPLTRTVLTELEGIICDSLHYTVTVDELYNIDIPPSGQTSPSETTYFEF